MNVDFQKDWPGYFITNLQTISRQDPSNFKINWPIVHPIFQVTKHQNVFWNHFLDGPRTLQHFLKYGIINNKAVEVISSTYYFLVNFVLRKLYGLSTMISTSFAQRGRKKKKEPCLPECVCLSYWNKRTHYQQTEKKHFLLYLQIKWKSKSLLHMRMHSCKLVRASILTNIHHQKQV